MLIAFFTLNIISFGRVLVGNNVAFYRFELILHHSNAVKLGFRYQVNKQHHSYSYVEALSGILLYQRLGHINSITVEKR